METSKDKELPEGWRMIRCIGDISCNGKETPHMPLNMGNKIWWKCSCCGNYSLKEPRSEDNQELHNRSV